MGNSFWRNPKFWNGNTITTSYWSRLCRCCRSMSSAFPSQCVIYCWKRMPFIVFIIPIKVCCIDCIDFTIQVITFQSMGAAILELFVCRVSMPGTPCMTVSCLLLPSAISRVYVICWATAVVPLSIAALYELHASEFSCCPGSRITRVPRQLSLPCTFGHVTQRNTKLC